MLKFVLNTVAGMVENAKKNRCFWFSVLLFLGAMSFVYWPVLPKWIVTSSPDDPPFYPIAIQTQQLEQLLTGHAAFTIQRILVFFDPVAIHEFAYVFDLLLFAWALAYYLRTQNVSRLAAYGGGLAGALSGYIFTLFCAGHLGEFHHFAVIFWALGLIDRCFVRRRLPYFTLLGVLIMWGQPWQPDVWVLVVGLLAFYSLWRMLVLLRDGLTLKALGFQILPRFLLTLAVAALVGVTGIRQVFEQHLASRDKQIEDTSRFFKDGQAAAEKEEAKKALERWTFATGWSLPPEDCAEFLVPGIFGNDSFRPPYPYWGRLGQPFPFQPGKMMPNYRQHTVYLGLVSLMLAFFGVLAWIPLRKSRAAGSCAVGGERPEAGDRLPGAGVSPNHTDVPFWCGVWAVCLILAMGRFTPVYKLFYSIPYMDYLRAPVKFLHFTEIATGLLAGFGLEALLSGRSSERLRRGFAIGAAVLAGLLGVAALLFVVGAPAVEKHIAGLGLGQAAAALRVYAVYNCLRAAGIAVAAAALFWMTVRQSNNGARLTAAVACLIALGVGDLALVARRFVIPINVKPFHEENLLVREMRQRTGGRPANVANYVTRNVWGQDWLSTSLAVHRFPNVIPDPGSQTGAERAYLMAFQSAPMKFWEVMGVRFVLVPRAAAEAFIRQGVLRPLCEVKLGEGTVRRVSAEKDSLVLCEWTAGGFPRVYFDWSGGVKAGEQVSAATREGTLLPVSDASAPASRSALASQPVAFSQSRGERGILVTRGTLELKQPGLLVWQERYSPDLVAFVDGKEVPLYQANGLWCAVQVPSGKHAVSCRMRYRPFWNAVSAATSLLVVVWFVFMVRTRKKDVSCDRT